MAIKTICVCDGCGKELGHSEVTEFVVGAVEGSSFCAKRKEVF